MVRNLLIYIFMKGQVNDMAIIYVQLIIKGKRTFASVPDKLKAQVREILIDLELSELIEE